MKNFNQKLTVTVFPAKEANVNAYVFSDGESTMIVDTTRSSQEAKELAALARAMGPDPEVIFVTHGHPDHYLGMRALKAEFPGAKILVPSEEIKNNIIGFTQFMESVQWPEGEPSMKIKSAANPQGFDYQKEIGVLDGSQLKMKGNSVIEVKTVSSVTEAAHEIVLYSKDLNAVFASDLVYNRVHLWLGVGVTLEAIKNWQEELDQLKSVYAPLKSRVYPGHGEETDAAIFDTNKKYMDDLLAAVRQAKSQDEAKAVMVEKYPGWANTDFLLVQSIKFQTELLVGAK
jgi:glyoxylase-like metal-dependent hydrolase (beta-lactamase superfamily II)